MKITDSEVIKSAEKELIDAVTADLDWGAIEEVFRKEHRLGIEEDVEYTKGDIVVHNNQVAYELGFEVKVTLSVLLDREGNYISVTSSGDLDRAQDEKSGESLEEPEEPDNDSEEKASDDLEGSADINGGLQTNNGPEKNTADEEITEPEDEYKEAMAQLDSTDDMENADITQPMSPPEGPQERISSMASQVGEMVAEIADEE